MDEVTLEVQAGDGGNGAATFRREKYVPHGGPNGGSGGKGGDIAVVSRPDIKTLIDLRYHSHWKAPRGGNGQSGHKHGADGEDKVIHAPVGTVVYDVDANQVLFDFTEPGQTCVVACGGRGGRGNTCFVSSTHRAPRFAEKGEPGDRRRLRLVLKILADVGIIGLPNAGKSTLISHISAAKPKIANYPFTTLTPNLGAVRIDSETSFIVADIPGIVEGAHEGRGLGHQFLRHVERTRVLVHLLDFAPIDQRNPLEDFEVLNRELELFDEELARKPQVVAANKMDVPEARTKLGELEPELRARGIEALPVSAVTGEGLQDLLHRVLSVLRSTEPPAKATSVETKRKVIAPRPTPRPLHIDVSFDYGYVVTGDAVERLVAMTDLDNPEAVAYMERKLQRMGLYQKLREAGIVDGDFVRIGTFVSNFVDEDKGLDVESGDSNETTRLS
ncbi:MAG: GTPase ObgE [Armatimonadetes bacterium]|nr:GTPase ObgE [Armatimonadota bacterium]